MTPDQPQPQPHRKIQTTSAGRHAIARRAVSNGTPAPSERAHQEWIAIRDLVIDRRYQRAVQMPRVKRMAANFDPDCLGTITVSRRHDGSTVVLDGQHRIAMLEMIGWGDQQVPALVYTGLSLVEEARIFRVMNDESVSPHAFDLFMARMTEGDPVVLAVTDIVESLGLRFAKGPGRNSVSAVSACERVYNLGGPTSLLYSLRTMRDAWENSHTEGVTTYPHALIVGFGVLYSRYGHLVNQKRLVAVLQRTWKPAELVRDARNVSKSLQGRNIDLTLIPPMVVNKYNQRIDESKRLPVWEVREDRGAWTPIQGAWSEARKVAG